MRNEGRGARSERLWLSAIACVFALSANTVSNATPFSFDDITYWVGSGSNRATMVIDWSDQSTQPPSLAWGYRWDGPAKGVDMFRAIVANDPRLFARMSPAQDEPVLYGVGYDANDNAEFEICEPGYPVCTGPQFNSAGFAFTDPSDLATANEPGDYYAEGWFTGFWHYGVAAANPYDGGSWSDTGVGMGARALADGAWDSWTFSQSFDFAAFAENPIAADPPFEQGDFDHNGHVDAADYSLWRSTFGSTSQLAADANDNEIIDAADYVIWRHAVATAGNESAATSSNVPEPATALLMMIFLMQLMIRRKPLMNANTR